MNYTHTHVSMDDWGLQCNIEVKDGYIYVVRRPSTNIARAFYVSDKDYNSNMKIMKIYFELTENVYLWIQLSLQMYLKKRNKRQYSKKSV
jgi:hypothetical protein